MKAELLISLRMSLTVSLLFLLFISGVVAQDGWAVNYNSKSFCALKGSEVTMSCTYTYPSGYRVHKAFWTKESGKGSEPPDLLDDPEYRGRVQYLGDEHSDCTLRFKTVREKDQSKYYFTFITDQPGGKYQGEGGVDLSVTDLQVEVPERVIEGDKVTLTCKTTCSLTVRPTFTWYRNGHRLSSSTDQLHLQPVSREDAGRYHCAVLGLNSPEVTLNVRYGPKSVSVSISPSGEIVEGISVTLTCSSDANPPVEYNWFKGTSFVAKGETYTMKKISSVDSGEYKCKSSKERLSVHQSLW
ncbi:B-cell receptor CD22-like [Colossoma macropomum]|uniref:B-cell receptor CD22-like n=1 Tax=Colossoma macropomum TaxID=42526 RepID=UPI00186515D4|nr:B-cell receptor CD22-like [Colossoma macropomum]